MSDIFEYLVLQNPSDEEITAAGLVGWELVVIKGQDVWFKRKTI